MDLGGPGERLAFLESGPRQALGINEINIVALLLLSAFIKRQDLIGLMAINQRMISG